MPCISASGENRLGSNSQYDGVGCMLLAVESVEKLLLDAASRFAGDFDRFFGLLAECGLSSAHGMVGGNRHALRADPVSEPRDEVHPRRGLFRQQVAVGSHRVKPSERLGRPWCGHGLHQRAGEFSIESLVGLRQLPNAFECCARIIECQVFNAPFFEGYAVLRLAAVRVTRRVRNLHFVEARCEAGEFIEAIEESAISQGCRTVCPLLGSPVPDRRCRHPGKSNAVSAAIVVGPLNRSVCVPQGQ